MDEDERIIHERINQLRIANGLSMKEFAERIGTSLDGVWRWEHSRLPSALKIVAIAKEFGVSTDWLLGLSEEEN